MIKIMHEYTKQIILLYRSAFNLANTKEEQPYYRIVKMPDEDDKHVHFQMINKTLVLKMLPEEIMRDDLLLGFKRTEIAILAHLGTKNEIVKETTKQKSNFFKVIKQIFSNGKTKFVIEKDNGEVTEHAVNDLLNEPTIVDKLTGQDGVKIGYIAAEEHYTRIAKLRDD